AAATLKSVASVLGRAKSIGGSRRLLALHESLEIARAPGLAQLAQRLGFDLSNPFARNRELFAYFFQRVVGLLPDPEAHAQDLLLARRQRRQNLARLLAQVALDRGLHGRGRQLVLDEIAERAFLLVADRRFQRDWLLDDLEHLLDLVERHLHLLGDLFRAR